MKFTIIAGGDTNAATLTLTVDRYYKIARDKLLCDTLRGLRCAVLRILLVPGIGLEAPPVSTIYNSIILTD